MDDVINVSGHRIGTAEVESALVAHAKVGCALVGLGLPSRLPENQTAARLLHSRSMTCAPNKADWPQRRI